MTSIPLRLGPLKADGYTIRRSGVRWLAKPGQMCAANQVVAYFNLELGADGAASGPAPFAEERELFVACAPRVAGRLTFDAAEAPGGYLSIFGFNRWNADTVIGSIDAESPPDDAVRDAGELRLLLLTGRRMTQLADLRSGLLSGWYSRKRAWWCDGGTPVTLLSLGICDVVGAVAGEDAAFLEMFRSEPAASQMVVVPDHPVAPVAPVLLDQLERSPAQYRAMCADVQVGLSRTGTTPTAEDWMFAGSMLAMLERNPIRETYDLLSGSGLTRSGPADAVLLSLSAEPPAILQHKKLGYRLHFLPHFHNAAGPAVRKWLADAFEPIARTIDDIKTDYERLLDTIEATTGALVIVLNRMSTSGDENVSSYQPFDAPLSATLANIASKELNVMLDDVADGRNVAIVDLDAMAADIGGAEHVPDGVHQSGAMQELVRAEILHALDGLRPER
jgi:hypothetical protein